MHNSQIKNISFFPTLPITYIMLEIIKLFIQMFNKYVLSIKLVFHFVIRDITYIQAQHQSVQISKIHNWKSEAQLFSAVLRPENRTFTFFDPPLRVSALLWQHVESFLFHSGKKCIILTTSVQNTVSSELYFFIVNFRNLHEFMSHQIFQLYIFVFLIIKYPI